MLVSEVLRGKGSAVVTLPPEAPVESLIGLLAQHRIGAVIVSSDGVSVEAIVSERDVVRVLAADGPVALTANIGSICTFNPVTTSPVDRVESLMSVMTEGRFRHLPVVAGGKLVGIISIGDVVKARMTELEAEHEALTGYITSGG
jgi:CBS domain-containing protein